MEKELETAVVEDSNTSEPAPTEDVVDSAEVDHENLSLDDIMGLTAEDYPEFADVNHSGMRPLHTWMPHLPEDVRKHIANLRRSHTIKMQDNARRSKELDEKLAQIKEQMALEKETIYNGEFAKKISETASDETQYDVYDPDGMEKEIDRRVAKQMEAMMKPVRERLAVEQQKMKWEKFKAEHPDITSPEMRLPVATLMRQRTDLSIQDAYKIVKSDVLEKKMKEEREHASSRRQQQRQGLSKISSGASRTPTGAQQHGSMWEAYLAAKAEHNKTK